MYFWGIYYGVVDIPGATFLKKFVSFSPRRVSIQLWLVGSSYIDHVGLEFTEILLSL